MGRIFQNTFGPTGVRWESWSYESHLLNASPPKEGTALPHCHLASPLGIAYPIVRKKSAGSSGSLKSLEEGAFRALSVVSYVWSLVMLQTSPSSLSGCAQGNSVASMWNRRCLVSSVGSSRESGWLNPAASGFTWFPFIPGRLESSVCAKINHLAAFSQIRRVVVINNSRKTEDTKNLWRELKHLSG